MKSLFLVFVLFAVPCGAVLPGFEAFVTQSALNYATKIGLGILETKMSTIKIADISGEKDSIDYTISEIEIHNLKIPDGEIKIQAGVGFHIAIAKVSGELTAHWHGREKVWPHPSGSGDATVDFSNTDITITMHLYDDNGRLQAKADSVQTSIGTLDLHFSGSGLDFLLDLLKHLFSNKIKDSAENGVTNAVINGINGDLNKELDTLPLSVVVGKVAELDFALTSNPEFATYLKIPLKGEFYQTGHKVEAPYTPTKLPATPLNGEMLQAVLGEYVLQTASYVFYKAGKMQIAIDNSMVPKSAPLNLNTTTWASIVPPLYQKYPGWAMKAVVTAKNPPSAKFTPKGADVFGEGSIDMYVITPSDGKLIEVFRLGLNVTADGAAGIKNNYLTGNLSYINSGVWLEKSYIGNFDTTQLKSIIKFLTLVVILPYFNYYLEIGIPIPSIDGVDFVSPTVSFGDGYVYVSSDLKYSPPLPAQ
eukprot:TRINITY_DN8330_c0_g1_i2.p1 TRINITY_DN8330_c0_g1~~TRINITY_DN8330_c0_g1_i2.p1  ORF type:complete len:476 (-),score=70.06 TRINITY_DN8330_c0_g1_i2:47-1474(-)